MSIELTLALTAAVAVMEFGLLCYCLVDCYWPEQEELTELDPVTHSLDESLIRIDTLITQLQQRDHENTLCRAEITRLRVVVQALRSVIPKENQ